MTSKKRETDTIYKETGDTYYKIIDFENTTEKKCREYDKKNNELYLKLLNIYNKQNKKLSKYSMQIDTEPKQPPKPSNYERLIMWKKRTIHRNVEEQSIAIVFLISLGYKIRIPGVCDDGIEPYNAIKIAKQISENNNIDMKRKIEIYQLANNLSNYYDNCDEIEEYYDDDDEIDVDEAVFGFNTTTQPELTQSRSYDENMIKTPHPKPRRRNTIHDNSFKLRPNDNINSVTNGNDVNTRTNMETDASTSTNNSLSPQTNINIGTELASSLMGIKPAGHSQQYNSIPVNNYNPNIHQQTPIQYQHQTQPDNQIQTQLQQQPQNLKSYNRNNTPGSYASAPNYVRYNYNEHQKPPIYGNE